MCLRDLLRMLFQSALTLRRLVCFPIDHYQRADKDQVTTIVFLLVSTCCSSLDCVRIPLRITSNVANSWYQALDAYTFWDYNESITPCDSYWIKHEAQETILTVWCTLTGFPWLSLLLHDWSSITGIIIIMRISPGLTMNENFFSVQHNTQYLSTQIWTFIGLLQASPSSIRVQFTDFGLNSVTFCTIIWHLVSCLEIMPTSFIYLGLHGGIPYFSDARRHGDACFLFPDSGMSDPDLIMNHGS